MCIRDSDERDARQEARRTGSMVVAHGDMWHGGTRLAPLARHQQAAGDEEEHRHGEQGPVEVHGSVKDISERACEQTGKDRRLFPAGNTQAPPQERADEGKKRDAPQDTHVYQFLEHDAVRELGVEGDTAELRVYCLLYTSDAADDLLC